MKRAIQTMLCFVLLVGCLCFFSGCRKIENNKPPVSEKAETTPSDATVEQKGENDPAVPSNGTETIPSNGQTSTEEKTDTTSDGVANSDGNETSSDGNEVPSDGNEVSSDGNATPSDGNEVPSDGNEVPSDGNETSSSGNETPSGGNEKPSEVESGGTEQPTVQVCSHTKTYLSGKRDASCSQTGYTGDTYCSNCNKMLSKGKTVAKLAHKTEVRNAVSATCSRNGYTGDTYCVNCRQTISKGKTIAKSTHQTEVRNAVSATCSQYGYTGDTYCINCNTKVSGGALIPETAHITELRNQREATTTSRGYTGDMVCTKCETVVEFGKNINTLPIPATPPVPENHEFYEIEMEIFRLINVEREKAGVAPLIWDENLYAGTKVRAEECKERWGHTRPNESKFFTAVFENSDYTWSNIGICGENLCMTTGLDETVNHYANDAMWQWMNSPGHKANILHAEFTHMAIAICEESKAAYIALNIFIEKIK